MLTTSSVVKQQHRGGIFTFRNTASFSLTRYPVIILCLALILSACGGGGGASTPWSGTKQFGVAGAATLGNSVATDAQSNVYVAGYTYGGLDGNTLTGFADFFVTKYNSAGAKQ